MVIQIPNFSNFKPARPISNNRLISFTGKKVSFWYKDHKNKGERKVMTLTTIEFIRRFLQHILPKNFYKIRYHGILAIANSKTKKQQCIALIGMQNEINKQDFSSGLYK